MNRGGHPEGEENEADLLTNLELNDLTKFRVCHNTSVAAKILHGQDS